jgi:DNA invertase Pin-like site-specific DNA recombinase
MPTYQQIGLEYDLTLDRVRQIFLAYEKLVARALQGRRWSKPRLHAEGLWHHFGPGDEYLGTTLEPYAAEAVSTQHAARAERVRLLAGRRPRRSWLTPAAPMRTGPRWPQPAGDRLARPRERAARAQVQGSNIPAVYGYVRVSTEDQATDGALLAIQQRQLEGWAMQRGWPIAQVVVEPGVSGGIPFAERPEGGKLWSRLQKGDVVVAAKLDRMFRSAADCLTVVEAFKTRGISLFLLDLNGGADDVSGNGIARLFLTIVSAFAEFERDRIGERIRATKRAQKARGERAAVRLDL